MLVIGPDTDTDLVTFANDAVTINGDLTLADAVLNQIFYLLEQHYQNC